MKSDGHWVLLDSLQFVNNLFLSIKVDDPLDISLRRIYTELIGKMMRYAKCSQGLHILNNTVLDNEGQVSVFEVHHLVIDESTSDYIRSAIERRQVFSESTIDELGLPKYVYTKLEGFPGEGLRNRINELLAEQIPCSPVIQDKNKWSSVFGELNESSSNNPNTDVNNNSYRKIICEAPDILVIPLSESNKKQVGGNLGVLLLWNNDLKGIQDLGGRLGERLLLAAKIFSVFITRLFRTHYGVIEHTYLPSFRKREQRTVAFMFADIRDFTPTTEIARNFKLIPQLTEFMLDFHQTMGTIVHKYQGRVHGLTGDGVMAIFGEHTFEEDAVLSALNAAKEMCESFEILKQEFFSNKDIKKFLFQEYESMSFRLGIGINFGSAIFDYFGAPGSRIYSPFGDHVNFAKRLESEASRYDERLIGRPGKLRAPILLSRPAWLRIKNILNHEKLLPEPLIIRFKGKPYQYEAYEFWPNENKKNKS